MSGGAVSAWVFLLVMLTDGVSATHFRGGIIMMRPQPGGTEYEMEISFHVSWRRSYIPNRFSVSRPHYCDSSTIATGLLRGLNNEFLRCQYGCSGSFISMLYVCTSFSIAEDWTFGERRLPYDFSFAAGSTLTIGYTGLNWIDPFSSSWNISTTFSLSIRNDTGRINSTPRAITAPVIRLQEGCNYTLALAVSDPDGDIVRCRWAQGSECGGICNGFPGAVLRSTCVIEYQANMGARFWAAAIMIEDFTPESSTPLSSVALQFLVFVAASTSDSTEICSQRPMFVQPTIRHGSCVAIPPGTTFAVQLIADSGSSDTAIVEIQTIPPQGTSAGALMQSQGSNSYYVNVIWTPALDQENQTHLFCFTAVRFDRVTSDQNCIDLLPGYFPPAPVPATATPNQELVHPSNTTWRIRFSIDIERSSVVAYVTFHVYSTEEEVYRIDASQLQEVTFAEPNEMSITPVFSFEEQMRFYIALDRGVVQGLEQCGPGNEPVTDKDFWTFETMDVTPPVITFLENPSVTNTNVSFSWESNENATWGCILIRNTTESVINCSEGRWNGYGLREGEYCLQVRAEDEAGNVAIVRQAFLVDLTPPEGPTFIDKPSPLSNQRTSTLTFSCNETCSYECRFVSNMTQESLSACDNGVFVTPILQSNTNYTLFVTATDQVGNRGESVSYTWETDFESPQIVGVDNISVPCNLTSPDSTGHAQATDNRQGPVSLTYSDVNNGCSIGRVWTAIDVAGNTAQLIQDISLEFSPTLSLLLQVTLQCDSTANSSEVSNNTASAPNPCELPLQLTYEDSEYVCPNSFQRNWTVISCGRSTTVSQTVRLYDLCQPHACGRNESTPRGICSFGNCQCNVPWYGEDCDILIFEPMAEPIDDIVLLEAQAYTDSVNVSQGSPPLLWTMLSGPELLRVDQYTGAITWRTAKAGNHSVVVQIENQVGRAQVSWTIQVIPGYTAFLSPISLSTLPYALPVNLTGYIEYAAANNFLRGGAGIVPVQVDIIAEGVTRTIETNTASNGNFSLTFYPSSTEYGSYVAGARHPNATQSLPQVNWRFLGLKSDPPIITLIGDAIYTYYNATVITNDGPGPLTGLTARAVLPSTSDISIEISLRGSSSNSTLEPGEQLAMDIRVEASTVLSGLFLVIVDSREGTTLQLIANLNIQPVLPQLQVDPPSLDNRIIRGISQVFDFNVTNVGRAMASGVRSIFPDTDIITFVSFGTAQQSGDNFRLENGESALLSILVLTQPNQQLGEIETTIIISSDEVYTPLPVSLIVSSSSLMNFTVIVEDEYTYFASGQPLVNDAIVTLINRQRNLQLTLSTGASNGMVQFINIYEDRYEMSVEAPSHRSLYQIVVTSSQSPVSTVFIERQTVVYRWTVTPVLYEDIYTISIEADFETHVPIPVVTVTPSEVNLLELESNPNTTIVLNITNHGLIRADNVNIQLPSHPFLQFSTPSGVVGDLEPLSSVIVAINTSRRSVQKRNAFASLGSAFANTVNWAVYLVDVVYSYVCNEPQFRSIPVVLKQPTICDNNQLSQPAIGTFDLRDFRSNGGRAYIDLGDGNNIGSPDGNFQLYLGRLGPSPRPRPFSFGGYSSETVHFCNPCISALLGCVPNVVELALDRIIPLGGCLPGLIMPLTTSEYVTAAVSLIKCAAVSQSRILRILKCATMENVFNTCLRSRSDSRGRRNVRSSINELVEAMYPLQQSIALGTEVLGDEVWISVGDSQWLSQVLRPAMDDQSASGVLISAAELSTILAAPPPNGTTVAMVERMVQRVNNTLLGWNSGQLEPEGSNMASFNTVHELAGNINTYNAIAVRKGFSSYLDAYDFASGEVSRIDDIEEEAGVCAVVRIRIQQQLAVTREAFVARLEIENREDSPLEQVFVSIIITDLISGVQATHLFSIGNESLSGSFRADVDGVGSLASGANGALEWLIIPYSEAAPGGDHVYNVGGTFEYIQDGENVTVPLLPAPITVRPDASLLVHYFLEKNVIADNPFTDNVEPSIPFTLGIAVQNAGYGTAYNVRLSSAKPEIINNDRGLLVEFMIIGANMGSEGAIPSLTVQFGDLAPNTTAVARWYMISSLQGEFMRYSATFENMNPLGDPKLSILDDLQTHELIRNVMIYDSNEDDGVLDFLVNDRNDYLAYPDALYSSKTLNNYTVNVGTVISVRTNSSSGAVSLVARTSSNSTGWVYYRYEDAQGILNRAAPVVNGTKYTGGQTVELPPENSWITSDQDMSGDETFFLHIVDYIETTDEVIFHLDPCTVDCPTLQLPFTRPTVKLPMPGVTILTPPGPLYAGSRILLTCNIDIDASLASNVNISVSWLKGNTPLSNATNRITISHVSDSQSTFTSTLTVYPLSNVDSTNFTCVAGIIPSQTGGFTSATASDLSESTVQINVQVPTLRITTADDSAFAGDTLNLTCSVVVVPDSLTAHPILTWSKSGLSTQQFASETATLSFSPLRTSDGGVYTCSATLSIPEAAVNVTETQVTTVGVKIPSPSLNITGYPRDEDYFQGLDITFTCGIELDSAVDSPVLVESSWWRDGTELNNDSSGGIVTVTNATVVLPPSTFQTMLRLNPMDIDDTGIYNCTVTIVPLNESFLTGTTISTVRNITDISSFPPQTVTITDEGLAVAGYTDYALLCNTVTEQHLSSLSTISVQWSDPEGLKVEGEVFTITESTDNNVATSRLTFNSLLTSQAGEYICRTLITIPGTEVLNYTVDAVFTVTVKLPAPEAVLILQSREDPLYEGTAFSLTCVITPNRTGVDTEMEIERSFSRSGPEASATDRITLSDTVMSDVIRISITFSPLIMNDTGAYECSAVVSSILPNITASDLVVNETELFIQQLSPPTVMIHSAVSLPTAGHQHSLECSAITENYLIALPVVKWISTETIPGVSEALRNNHTSTLTFNLLRTSHGGRYTCEVRLDIPQAGIINLTASMTENLIVHIPTPMLSILDHSVPYNGTVFTLSGVAAPLDDSVDTNITAVGTWSDDNSQQVSPYQTDLEFRPLATDSSKEYTLNVTFTPTDSSPFIAASSGNVVYDLIVQPLPSLAPIITVASRDSNCGEARILNCTNNPVKNLFVSPTLTWISPDGSEVPVEETNSVMFDPWTNQLVFSNITTNNSGLYVCRAALNISEAQIWNHFDDTTITVNSDTPGPVEQLMCNRSSTPSELDFSWEPPTFLGEEVTDYQVEVEEVRRGDDTSDVVLVSVTDFNTEMKTASLNEGLRGMVPYMVRVKALNSAGCGNQHYIYCFTQEGVPPPPKNVLITKVNSTAINVSWEKQTIAELKGLAEYIVEYTQVRKRQSGSSVTVPWTENHVVISDLIPGAEYDVFVSTSTSVGTSDVVPGVRAVASTPPPAAGIENIVIYIAVATVAFVSIIAIIGIIVVIVVRKGRNEYKPNEGLVTHLLSQKPPVSSERLGPSYQNPCYEEVDGEYTRHMSGKQEGQQSSL